MLGWAGKMSSPRAFEVKLGTGLVHTSIFAHNSLRICHAKGSTCNRSKL